LETRSKFLAAGAVVGFLLLLPVVITYTMPDIDSTPALLSALSPLLIPSWPLALGIAAIISVDAVARRRSPLWALAGVSWPGLLFYLGSLAVGAAQRT
jgi:hypothetical protein